MSRALKHPGPDLARVDLDVSAAGACQDCPKSFRSFTASTTHAAAEQHTVRVTETRIYDVTPRSRKETHAWTATNTTP